ncbi:MAG: baseplate J/gp47 family protein [Halanaerobiales bacterium]
MSNGFERKTRTEIVEDMQAKAKNLWGNDINLAINTLIGIFIHLISYPISLLWFGLEAIYNAMDINAASGQDLDNKAKLIGITRYSGQKSVGEVTFTGDDGTFIPEGFQIETDETEAKVYETTEEVVISDGTATAEIISLENGSEYDVSADTITKMTEVISGIDSLTNNNQTLGGRDRENDTELRERYFDSLDRPGGSTTSSIRANILEETEASACIVLENITMEEDDDGLPPKSFESIVYGGATQSIADAIFEKKPAGIEPFGETSVIVTDDSLNEQIVAFSRATPVDIYFEIDLATNSDFPSDGNDQVIENVVDYIDNLSISDNVIYHKVIDVIFDVTGVEDVTTLYIGTDENPTGETNITIDSREVSETESDNVVIL